MSRLEKLFLWYQCLVIFVTLHSNHFIYVFQCSFCNDFPKCFIIYDCSENCISLLTFAPGRLLAYQYFSTNRPIQYLRFGRTCSSTCRTGTTIPQPMDIAFMIGSATSDRLMLLSLEHVRRQASLAHNKRMSFVYGMPLSAHVQYSYKYTSMRIIYYSQSDWDACACVKVNERSKRTHKHTNTHRKEFFFVYAKRPPQSHAHIHQPPLIIRGTFEHPTVPRQHRHTLSTTIGRLAVVVILLRKYCTCFFMLSIALCGKDQT